MSYRLIITRPNGETFQTSTEPIATMTEVGLGALRALGEEQVPTTIGDAKRLGARVRDTPLGETITHAASGYAFRTEEF